LRGVCRATKRNGEPCTLPATGQHGFCWAHDPANAEARRRTASKGGRSKASREVVGLKAQLGDLTQDVLAGELETSRAAVANQLINTYLRAIELERRIKETDEVGARLEALERRQGFGVG
jgi:LPS O-antigen subunit length determinant protein (WzzB/FepE family)